VTYPIACTCHVKVRCLDCQLFHRPEFTPHREQSVSIIKTSHIDICIRYLCKVSVVFCLIVNKAEIFQQVIVQVPDIKLHKISLVGVMFLTDRQKNTWMGSHYEASVHCALQTQLKIISLLQF
jgi:hypothetical protein